MFNAVSKIKSKTMTQNLEKSYPSMMKAGLMASANQTVERVQKPRQSLSSLQVELGLLSPK